MSQTTIFMLIQMVQKSRLWYTKYFVWKKQTCATPSIVYAISRFLLHHIVCTQKVDFCCIKYGVRKSRLSPCIVSAKGRFYYTKHSIRTKQTFAAPSIEYAKSILHEFTNLTSRIHEFNFTISRIQLHELNFTNSISRIHEFSFTNSRI